MCRASGPGRGLEAAVVGLSAGGLALGRALSRLGLRVLGVYENEGEPGRWSNSFDRVLRRPSSPRHLAALLGGSRAAVFPCSDTAVDWLRGLEDAPAPGLAPFLPPPGVYRDWFDKSGLARADGEEFAFLHPPRTAPLADWREAARWGGPWIAKPVSGAAASRSGLAKTERLTNREDLEAYAMKNSAHGEKIVLQEWIDGPDDCHGFVGGYATDDGAALIFQVGRKVRQYPTEQGVSIHARRAADPGLEELSRRFLARIGQRGFFEIEWKWDARLAAWRFIEINTRPWATLAMSPGRGAALARAALADAGLIEEGPGASLNGTDHPREWIDDYPLILERLKGRAAYPWRQNGSTAHAYRDRTDPLPFLSQYGGALATKLRGGAKR